MPSSRSRQAELARLGERPFAHRGLHGGGRIENSRAAFEAAIEAGFGIELDIQASREGEAFVFHDWELDRLSVGAGLLAESDAASLAGYRLRGCDETIPTFAEILALVAGRVPLLVEVKARGPAYRRLCEAAAAALEAYSGPVGIMSFNPRVSRWFARHHRQCPRGLVVTESGKRGLRGSVERAASFAWSRAEFLAYDIGDLPSAFAGARRAAGVPVYTWTVRSDDERARAAAHADQIIFETPS
ncbi:MAG TPA: glycerophosphodiester phosphodiesterase family protein [Allosphingosinicella sp.]|nr:glycerophosphodiester phosphodiesterase family protein [Allosphingosinicella sp.]